MVFAGCEQVARLALAGTGDVYIHRTPDVGFAHPFPLNFAQNGDQYLDLSGGIGGGSNGLHALIFQDFATTPLRVYDLSFFTAAAFTPYATNNVRIDGATAVLNQTLTASVPATDLVWTEQRFRFLADSTTTRLSFQDVSNRDDNVSFIDNVAINLAPVAVPEPNSALVVFIGMPLFILRVVRNKKPTNKQSRSNVSIPIRN